MTDDGPASPGRVRDVPRRRLVTLWWTIVVIFAVHNAEEWLADLPSWAAAHPVLPTSGLHESQDQFGIAVAIITGAAAVVAAVATARPGRWSAEVLSCFAAVLLLNAGSHVVLSLVTWSLMPGVVTGVVLLVPAGIAIVRTLPRVRATWPAVVITLIVAVAATVGSLALAGLIAGRF